MKKIILSLLIAIIGFGAGWYTLAPGLDFFVEKAKNVRNPKVVQNGAWGASMDIGSSRATALFRALTAKMGLGANSSDEAIYWLAIKDKNGERLTGGKTYEVRFSQPPAINQTAGFWSLCVYNSKDQFVPNPMKRYNLGDRSPLVKNADGSFTIDVSPRQPKEINNWLPTPIQKEPIMLTMRMYAPQAEVLKAPGKSPMPEIILINEARN
jgi:hypothetical protein